MLDFFGEDKDPVLRLILMSLNENWKVRKEFYSVVPAIGKWLGKKAFGQHLYQFLPMGLSDKKPVVIMTTIKACEELVHLKIFDSSHIDELVQATGCLLFHPSVRVRKATLDFLVTAASLEGAKTLILRHILPCLFFPIVKIDVESLREALKPPLDMATHDLLLSKCRKVSEEELLNKMPSHIAEDRKLFHLLFRQYRSKRSNEEDRKERNVVLDDFKNEVQPHRLTATSEYYHSRIRDDVKSEYGYGRQKSTSAWSNEEKLPSLRQASRDVAVFGALSIEPGSISRCSFFKNHPPQEDDYHSIDTWQPVGQPIAQLTEHSRSITEIAVAQDNLFFASASLDQTVKLWSVQSVTEYPTTKSLASWTPGQSGVTTICVCENSHAIACGTETGGIYLCRAEYSGSNFMKLNTAPILSSVCPKADNCVVKIRHFISASQALLVFATTMGGIFGYDLKQGRKLVFNLQMEPEKGTVTVLELGPNKWTLVVGTSRGGITVWDIRYQIQLQSWRHFENSAIVSITCINTTRMMPQENAFSSTVRGPLLFVTADGTNEVSACDIWKSETRLRLKVRPPRDEEPELSQMSPAASFRRRPLKGIPPTKFAVLSTWDSSINSGFFSYDLLKLNAELQGMCDNSGNDRPAMTGFLASAENFCVTAGRDRVIRLWDLKNPKKSRRLSSPPTKWHQFTQTWTDSTEGSPVILEEMSEAGLDDIFSGGSVSKAERLDRTEHSHAITDLKAIEFQRPLLISADRGGMIKIWL